MSLGEQCVHHEPLLCKHLYTVWPVLRGFYMWARLCYIINLTFLFHPVLKDYPSIAHLVQKLSDNNIQTIFAVTEEFQPVYQVSSLSASFRLFFSPSDTLGLHFYPFLFEHTLPHSFCVHACVWKMPSA